MSNPTINKYTEISLAGNYPAFRLNQRERKILQTSEEYTPAIPGNWSPIPTTVSGALDTISSAAGARPFGAVTTSVVWDFSVNGGAVSTIDLGVSLPAKAIVLEVVRDILVIPDSTGHTGTIRLGLVTDGAVEQTALVANGSNSGQAQTGGTSVPKKTTVTQDLSVTIAVAALTVGRIRWFVRYAKSE